MLRQGRENFFTGFKGRVRSAEPLKRHTTFKIGGPSEFFIWPRSLGDLKLIIAKAKKTGVPVFVIGGGSNILASDSGVKAAVLCLDSPYFKRLSCKGSFIEAGSGLKLKELLTFSRRHNLSGIEFLVGIPGTVGGALMMNAGAVGSSISEFVERVKVMDYNCNIKFLKKRDIRFRYRSSGLENFVILDVYLRLKKKPREEIDANLARYRQYRLATQDYTAASAGCVFKNPAEEQAGYLIDSCGLKGKKIGGAAISLRHANFIINKKNARASDVLKLMDLAKKKVREKFNITLRPEIKIWR